jgi:2-oxoglutarate ferredoxin oxidoreductase subunit beta
LCKLVEAAGGTYVARFTTFHVNEMVSSMKIGLQREGFSFIEVVSHCPVQYGRFTGLKDPVKSLMALKELAVPLNRAKSMSESELAGKTVIGEFVDRRTVGLTKAYEELLAEIPA